MIEVILLRSCYFSPIIHIIDRFGASFFVVWNFTVFLNFFRHTLVSYLHYRSLWVEGASCEYNKAMILESINGMILWIFIPGFWWIRPCKKLSIEHRRSQSMMLLFSLSIIPNFQKKKIFRYDFKSFFLVLCKIWREFERVIISQQLRTSWRVGCPQRESFSSLFSSKISFFG